MDDNKKRKGIESMRAFRGGNVNICHHLDSMVYGPCSRRYQYMTKIRRILIGEKVGLGKLECFEELGGKFRRRITALCWHTKDPFLYAVASKFGDILVGSVERDRMDSGNLKLQEKWTVEGRGAGGSITAMKFDENASNILYRTSIDSTVSKLDLHSPSNTVVFKDTDSYEHWFTSMDVNFHSKVLAAGDNKGTVHLFDLNGKEQGNHRLHKTKVHWVEFSKKDPNLLVTAPLSENSKTGSVVKIWDIRKINLMDPVFKLPHRKGVNVATFNSVDGSKLLTSDQEDEIRVYQGPFWDESVPIVIKHWHKQFQHITPIKADWHPLHDLIVIGNYPKNPLANDGPKTKPSTVQRAIEFYDAETGRQVGEIFHPSNLIVGLNVFNPTGEFLASAINANLVFWKPEIKLDTLDGKQSQREDKIAISGTMQNILRGKGSRKTREFSPVSDEEEDENHDNQKKTKRPRKAASSSTATSTTRGARGSRSSTRTLSSANTRGKNSDSQKGKGKK